MANRVTEPSHLQGATEFSEERALLDPLWAIKQMKQTHWLYADLERETLLDKNWGRRKEPGSWALAYLGFVVSGYSDFEPWWAQTSLDLWRAAGFQARPSYQTTYERFVELESVSEAFSNTAAKLIQHARKHEPRIGAHIHVDGTEAETHAALVHDCQPGEGCKGPGGQKTRTAARPKRETTERVRAERQKDAEQEPKQEGEPIIGDADEVKEMPDGRLRIRVGGHWYRTLDKTAGVRAYIGPRGAKRFWHGYYNEKAIDHFTGAPVAIGVFNASRQECDIYPELYQRVFSALGDNPEVVVADRGFSTQRVFEWNTRLGVASVMPWRKKNGHDQRHDEETHDRHGVPRCKHCGAPCRFVRFAESPNPRLWFRCVRGTTHPCGRDQSIACAKDWRLLVPLWRTDPIYHELASSHGSYERVHRHWRERYRVGGDGLSLRPKRRGIAVQELRAQAALLVEWLCISWREGWLGSARRNKKGAVRFPEKGQKRLQRVLQSRAKNGLTVPYGAVAAALGVGPKEPPSRRGPAPPGGPPDAAAVPF
jgi:hypothetical protein